MKKKDDFITTIAPYAPLALLGLGVLHLLHTPDAVVSDNDAGLGDAWSGDSEYAVPGYIAPKPEAPAPPNGWCFKKDRSGHLVAVPCGAPASSASHAVKQQRKIVGASNSAPARAPVAHANTETPVPYVWNLMSGHI